MITEAILYRLDSDALAKAIVGQISEDAATENIEEDLQSDRLQLDELAQMYGHKEMTAREWTAAKAPIQQRIATNERRLNAFTGTSALDGYVGNAKALRGQWDTIDPPRQRAIISALLNSITIGAGVRGRNKFDPSRIKPDWKV